MIKKLLNNKWIKLLFSVSIMLSALPSIYQDFTYGHSGEWTHDVGWFTLFYRIIIMDIRYMENLEKQLKQFEEDIFAGKDIDITEFYMLKKSLLDITLSGHVVEDHSDLLEIHSILENMLDRKHNELMNKRLNLLTIWSTIFLPLSFYTGVWGMNFDDIPLITEDHGFWIFLGLTIVTVVGMFMYFKKNKWL